MSPDPFSPDNVLVVSFGGPRAQRKAKREARKEPHHARVEKSKEDAHARVEELKSKLHRTKAGSAA